MSFTSTIFREGPAHLKTQYKFGPDLTVGVAIVARDAERSMQRCLDSLIQTDFDQILVLDTGSRDRTREVVAGYEDPRIRAHQTAWTGSFASARNRAMELVSTDWVFFLDADEWLSGPTDGLKGRVQAAATSFNEYFAFAPLILEQESSNAYLDIPRIMHVETMRFEGPIHEYPVLAQHPGTAPGVVGLNIQVAHDGYSNEVVRATNKVRRNLEILDEALRREPSNPRWLFYRLRDGASAFDVSQILDCVARFDAPLVPRIDDPHSPEEYHERARISAIDRLISLGAWTEALLICADLDKGGSLPHPDAEYFRGVSDLYFHECDERSLLRLVGLRKNPAFVARSRLDASGRPLDAVIAGQLFRLRGPSDANALLQKCEPWTDQFFDASVWRRFYERD